MHYFFPVIEFPQMAHATSAVGFTTPEGAASSGLRQDDLATAVRPTDSTSAQQT